MCIRDRKISVGAGQVEACGSGSTDNNRYDNHEMYTPRVSGRIVVVLKMAVIEVKTTRNLHMIEPLCASF